MLVLGRKEDQELRIGPDITVKVVAIGLGKVRLGIDAPPEVQILRPEAKVQEPKFSRGEGEQGSRG